MFESLENLKMNELLEIKKILSHISIQNQRSIADIEIFQSLPSTNTYLLNLAKNPIPSGYVCLAEEQTLGRGRQGKVWHSPHGKNIYCSIIWNFPATNTNFANLSLAIGVILCKTLERIGVNKDLKLKWPNDIYVQDRKIAGILIETAPRRAVVIGIGLNVNASAGEKSTCLLELLGKEISRNEIVAIILEEIVTNLPLYIENNFAYFYAAYHKYDMLLGKFVVIRTPTQEIPGIAQGVTETGELKLRDELGKIHYFRCGEVSVIL